jgi:hypothetical protein
VVSLDPRTRERSAPAARLDEHGAFVVGPVAPGRYRLTVEGGGVRLIVDRLDVM